MRLRANAVSVVSIAGVVGVALAACGEQPPPPKSPPAPQAPKDPPMLARIAAACARVSACTEGRGADRFHDPSACLGWWLSDATASEPLRKCLTEATTCEQVRACRFGGGDERAAAFCSQRSGVVAGCDGERLISCGAGDMSEGSVVDCARMGATCRESKVGGLVTRACVSPEKCPAGSPELRCDGPGAIVQCRDTAVARIVCEPGTTCVERTDAAGDIVASCELPNGRRACGDVRVGPRCEGDRLFECDYTGGPPGELHVTDCAGFGLRCTGVGPRAACRVAHDVECDSELLPRCEGASLVFCAAGRLTKVACRDLGLGACDPAAKGPIAACTPASPSTPTVPPK